MVNAAAPRFPDIQSHWARSFIEALAQRGTVRGFDDGTFRPDQTMSRAEYAAIARAAFPSLPVKRPYVPFVDIAAGYWAAPAIRWAYEVGLLSGYPDRSFRPTEAMPRAQVWVSLVNGLGLSSSGQAPLSELYADAAQIPSYATGAIATATEVSLVINVPERTRLRPTQAATRADVAAAIYQCLVALGQVSPIDSEWIVRWVRLITVGHTRELRGAWVASVWNIDWPSQRSLTPAQQQAEFIALVDKLQAMHFNTLVFQVRPEGDAFYASTLEPWSYWLTGTQGKAPEPFYDPLEFAIAQCHQRNIELHAWFNPYRARTSANTVNVRPHLAATHPDVVYPWGNQLWMDPGAKVVQDRTYAVIMDVVKRYDIDGIHLDDYFYPYPISGQTFPDDKTYQAYRAAGGTLALADWRRDNVNQLIQRIASGIRATKPHVKFGISPFGIYRPGQPPQIKGLDAYDQLYADSLKWLQQGWVDYLAPQLYWRIDPPAQSYSALLTWWVDQNTQRRHLYPGNNLALLVEASQDTSEIERQIEITRQLQPKLAGGNLFYSMKSLAANRSGIGDRLKTALYKLPSLAPVMPWLPGTPPPPPRAIWVRQRTVFWMAATPQVRAWSLYRQGDGDQWTLQTILPKTTLSLTLPPGRYAICTVDRLARESRGAIAVVT